MDDSHPPSGRDSKPPADSSNPLSVPAPHHPLRITRTHLPPDTLLHRIHNEKYHACQFNPGLYGNARFSPVSDSAGSPIPSLYGGLTPACAMMETIFHDIPCAPGFKTLDKNKLCGLVLSALTVTRELTLADLSSIALRKLGVSRRQLIETEKCDYPSTRLWAQAIHRQCTDIQGLSWVSRQDDSARAVILFGDRISAGILQPAGGSRPLLTDPELFSGILSLADKLDVLIIPGAG